MRARSEAVRASKVGGGIVKQCDRYRIDVKVEYGEPEQCQNGLEPNGYGPLGYVHHLQRLLGERLSHLPPDFRVTGTPPLRNRLAGRHHAVSVTVPRLLGGCLSPRGTHTF